MGDCPRVAYGDPLGDTMKFLVLLSAVSLLALSSLPAAGAAGAPADTATSELDKLIDGVSAHTATITDYEAKFFQEVKRKHLPRALKRSGTVYFKKPGMMRWDYRIPERVYYISDGEVLWSYEAREKLAYKLPVKDSELYSALKFLFGQGQLREEFRIALVKVKGEGLKGLELTPKVPQSGYSKLVLEVDPTTFDIQATVLFDAIGNESRVRFERVKTTQPLKVEAFRFTPPDGVRVEDLTRSVGAAP